MPLIEELDTKKHIPAPGYAYVPDTGPKVTNALVPAGRNRAARNHPNANAHESTAKQDAKITRRLAELDKDNSRDISIPVPIRHRDNAGRASHGKVSSNVRKILGSLKTFANYLSDAEAEAALKASQPQSSSSSTTTAHTFTAPSVTPVATTRTTPGQVPVYGPHLTSKGTRSHKKKVPINIANVPAVSTPLRKVSTATNTTPNTISSPIQPPSMKKDADGDTVMGTDDIKPPDLDNKPQTPPHKHLNLTSIQPPLPSHPKDDDPLLLSHIPSIPTSEELDTLLAAPPLSYNEARAKATGIRPPARIFCEICGYWGRGKCVKCGGRICGVECLGVHEEFSCVKFYA